MIRSLAHEIKADTTNILDDTSTIKQDTSQILIEIAQLRAQLPPEGGLIEQQQTKLVLERYLDASTTYAETMVDDDADQQLDLVSTKLGDVRLNEKDKAHINDNSNIEVSAKTLEVDTQTRGTSQSSTNSAESDLTIRFKRIVVEHLGVPEDKVFPHSELVNDLGADSLDSVELMQAFEEEAGVDFDDYTYHEIVSLADAVTAAENKIAYNDVAKRVKDLVLGHLGVSRDALMYDADLVDDLGADSLDMVELTMALEEEFQMEINNWYHTTALGDLIRSIHKQRLQYTGPRSPSKEDTEQ
jgi:acyl carrier protein